MPRMLTDRLPKALVSGFRRIGAQLRVARGVPRSHPSPEDLERFLRGGLPARDNLNLLQHLLSGCPRCRAVTATFWWLGTDPEAEPGEAERARYDRVVARAYSRVRRAHAALLVERAGARRLAEGLERVPLAARKERIAAEPHLRNWGICEHFLRRGAEQAARGGGLAEELAATAVALAEALDPAEYPPAILEDLSARAWAALGDARRALGRFEAAEEAFRQGERHLERGTGGRLEKARFLELLATLRDAQDRPEEAARLLRRAAAVYRRAGQWPLLGRVLLGLGDLQAQAGEAEPAVDSLRRGLALADFEGDPRLWLVARRALARLLHAEGSDEEALAILARGRSLAIRAGDPLDLVRLRALEESIAAALGRRFRAAPHRRSSARSS